MVTYFYSKHLIVFVLKREQLHLSVSTMTDSCDEGKVTNCFALKLTVEAIFCFNKNIFLVRKDVGLVIHQPKHY